MPGQVLGKADNTLIKALFNRILRWLIDRLSRFLRLRAQMLF